MKIEPVLNSKSRIKFIKYSFLVFGILTILFLIILPISYNYKHAKDSELSDDNKFKKLKTQKKLYELSITKPTFEGLSQDNSPYKIDASEVLKIDENTYELNSINAGYQVDNKDVNINALFAILNIKDKNIYLENSVQVDYEGIKINTKALNIDINTKKAFSNKEVKVLYKKSQIQANSFESNDSTKFVKLGGRVKCIFDPDDFE